MKKRFLLSVLILICTIIFLSACGSNTKTGGNSVPNGTESSNDSSEDTENMEYTEDTESGSNFDEKGSNSVETTVSVTPPEGWEPTDYSPHLAEYTKDTALFMVMKEYFNTSNLDELVQQAKSAFKGSFLNIEYIGEVESITVGGKDAKKLVFNCDGGDLKIKYWYVFFYLGKDPHSAVFSDTSDIFDNLTGDFEQILESISFK